MFNYIFHYRRKANQEYFDLLFGKIYHPHDHEDNHAFRFSLGRNISDKPAIMSLEEKYIPLIISNSTLSIYINN